MNKGLATIARQLGSISLRYRQGLCAARGPAAWTKPANRGAGRVRRARPDVTTVGASGPFARGDALAKLEAILLLCHQPRTSRKLAELADLADGTETRTLVRKLNGLYDAGSSAFRVEEIAGGFQLRTRSGFAPWLRRLHTVPVEVRLSPPAMETLAVVAYRQPVLRAEVEAIRGVQCGEILRQLIERDLVRIDGRSEELGRPFLYGTSKRFLQVFGLRHTDELPRADSLRTPYPTQQPPDTEQPPTDEIRQQTPNEDPTLNNAQEECDVKDLAFPNASPEGLAERDDADVDEARLDQQPMADLDKDVDHEDEDEDDEDDFDDYDDEDDDDEEDEKETADEDEGIEDQPWEEVEDDDDQEEEDDEDWDEDEDWDDMDDEDEDEEEDK